MSADVTSSGIKTVLITGAGARVGAHIARGLAAQGWKAAIHYNRSRKGADAIVSDIQAQGGQAAAVQGNLFVPQDVDLSLIHISEPTRPY